jgi:hypothetical protein
LNHLVVAQIIIEMLIRCVVQLQPVTMIQKWSHYCRGTATAESDWLDTRLEKTVEIWNERSDPHVRKIDVE